MLYRWNRVIYTIIFEEKDRQWSNFKARYTDPSSLFTPLLDYIQKEQLDNCPERFLHYYTAQYLHLNEIATSRTESAHQLLKQGLRVSNHDLLGVLRSFNRSVEYQFSKIQYGIEEQKIRRLAYIPQLYKLLYTRISIRAIKLTKAVYARYLPLGDDKPLVPPICTCNSKETAGFLCIHIIQQYNTEQRSLEPALYHQHQHLDSVDAPPA